MHVEVQVHEYVCAWQYRYMYVCAYRGTCTFMLMTVYVHAHVCYACGDQKSLPDAFLSPQYF